MSARTLQSETTAEAYLELLKDRGIDVFLGNAGTDFASLVEAFARLAPERGRAPRPLVVPHEFVAVSMARIPSLMHAASVSSIGPPIR